MNDAAATMPCMALVVLRTSLISLADIYMRDQDFLRGFVKAYALWRSSRPDAYGLRMLEEAAERGWRISAGTLYPILAKLLRERDVSVRRELTGGKWRKTYRLTAKGARELIEVRERLAMLAKLLGE